MARSRSACRIHPTAKFCHEVIAGGWCHTPQLNHIIECVHPDTQSSAVFSLIVSGAALQVAQLISCFFSISQMSFKCPVCSKFISSDEMDLHLVMCLTKPRVTYNEDVLTKDAGECAICLEELVQGDTIARLPCLCIYHKGCIDEWFEVNRSCPEHPSD
ncbi:hypothetical protein QQF64_009145 [Cirrhinus molitorella]|uniref:RING-type E3 ubiquitin transferase n=1 Tax=Cirrhinus molitorella TaxID=172907 RepID=A0ABR3M0C3_9TELE